MTPTPPEMFTLNLVSPEKLLFSQEVEMAVIPGSGGDFAILPRHESLISSLRPGLIEIYEDKAPKDHIFVSGGFAEVSDDVCHVLSEEVIYLHDINITDLEQVIQNTRENLEMARTNEERQNLQLDLNIANTKVYLAKKLMKS